MSRQSYSSAVGGDVGQVTTLGISAIARRATASSDCFGASRYALVKVRRPVAVGAGRLAGEPFGTFHVEAARQRRQGNSLQNFFCFGKKSFALTRDFSRAVGARDAGM